VLERGFSYEHEGVSIIPGIAIVVARCNGGWKYYRISEAVIKMSGICANFLRNFILSRVSGSI
jgi:predicted transcriptional regulator with HTH domain